MSPPIGWKPVYHDVTCLDCGKWLRLASHWKQPHCQDCRKRLWNKGNALMYRIHREEARRYRILMHHLGWPDTPEGFAECLREIRRSPMAFRKEPETRAAKLDLTWERKLRRKSA